MAGGRVLPSLTLTRGHTSNFPVGAIPTLPKAVVQEFLQVIYRPGYSALYWRVIMLNAGRNTAPSVRTRWRHIQPTTTGTVR